MNRYDLPDILYKSIKEMGGQTSIIDICKYIWEHYNNQLLSSGDLFYTWQYDIRWAATELRKTKRMKAAEQSPKGIWEIIYPDPC
jgi:glycerol-3-phosphate O-acyltransferase